MYAILLRAQMGERWVSIYLDWQLMFFYFKWGAPQVVKGCLSGKMIRNDIRSHCEAADPDGDVSIIFKK